MRRESEIVALLRKRGFVKVRQNTHQIWACPCGHQKITVSCSGYRGRGNSNCTALIARTLKACKEREVAA